MAAPPAPPAAPFSGVSITGNSIRVGGLDVTLGPSSQRLPIVRYTIALGRGAVAMGAGAIAVGDNAHVAGDFAMSYTRPTQEQVNEALYLNSAGAIVQALRATRAFHCTFNHERTRKAALAAIEELIDMFEVENA